MSNDTLEKIVCLRNSRILTAVTVLKKIYVDEAKHWHVAHDISARLSQLPLALAPGPAISTSASNLAQSLEADDSSMFPLSDPE